MELLPGLHPGDLMNCRLLVGSVIAVLTWLSSGTGSSRALHAQSWRTNLAGFPSALVIPAGGKGGFTVGIGVLPLTRGGGGGGGGGR